MGRTPQRAGQGLSAGVRAVSFAGHSDSPGRALLLCSQADPLEAVAGADGRSARSLVLAGRVARGDRVWRLKSSYVIIREAQDTFRRLRWELEVRYRVP